MFIKKWRKQISSESLINLMTFQRSWKWWSEVDLNWAPYKVMWLLQLVKWLPGSGLVMVGKRLLRSEQKRGSRWDETRPGHSGDNGTPWMGCQPISGHNHQSHTCTHYGQFRDAHQPTTNIFRLEEKTREHGKIQEESISQSLFASSSKLNLSVILELQHPSSLLSAEHMQ